MLPITVKISGDGIYSHPVKDGKVHPVQIEGEKTGK
jgi:hypothetical protein